MQYFVNINSSYDLSANNYGTSADPLNFSEFQLYLSTLGANGNTYYLQGMRIIELPIAEPMPYIAINSNFESTIDVWDGEVYGPWILISEDYYVSNNMILDFKYCTLKNGIIYNSPAIFSEQYYGGTLKFSSLYDMWIVNQGLNSKLIFYPYSTESSVILQNTYTSANDNYQNTYNIENIEYQNTYSSTSGTTLPYTNVFGCTIYSENGVYDVGLESDININDSVFFNFNNTNNQFSLADITINNSVFNTSAITISADFNSIILANSQYNFDIPTDFAFKTDSSSYLQNIDWLRNNLNVLQSFAGINTPPQPGYGYSGYIGYEKGLFNSNR